MIPNQGKEGWHYLAVTELSTLRGITSKDHSDFYCLNCLCSFRTENRLKSLEKVCKNKDFCGIAMPSEKDNILEFNQYMKSDKMSYTIYADIESLIRKINRCANNPETSSTKNQVRIFLVDIQCQQFGDLIIQKTSILYIWEKII